VAVLAVLSCGDPSYRLDGAASTDVVGQVALADSTATGSVDALYRTYSRDLDSLRRETQASLDSLSGGLDALGEPLSRAKQRLRAALRTYSNAFAQSSRFRSFGGNPVFTTADAKVPTRKLLEETADRFYRGKAFSLETGTQIRAFLRSRLAPLEKRVSQARARVSRLERSRAGNTDEKARIQEAFARASSDLLTRTNGLILEELEARILVRTDVDSTGEFLFRRLPCGRYTLYARHTESDAWLLPVELRTHTRQELSRRNRRQLLIAEKAPPEPG